MARQLRMFFDVQTFSTLIWKKKKRHEIILTDELESQKKKRVKNLSISKHLERRNKVYPSIKRKY